MATNNGQQDILASLNTAQRRAVTSKSDTVAILAGPGSGKTHTLTSRVVWLIQEAGHRPSDMIVATFTVKASREMRERIGKALGEEAQKKIILGTFHSIARRYLVYYGKNIGLDSKFGIADDGDSKAILQRLIKRLDLKLDPAMAKGWISKRKSRGSMDPPEQSTFPNGKPKRENPELLRCFDEYQSQLSTANLLDYDDLLVRCVELLRVYPICVSNIKVVLVDEYQDTNGIQYDLMRLLAQQRHRITIVGDPDQSIYGWRSAEIRNLHRLLQEFPGTDEISLEENYRSSRSILDASLTVIRQDTNRYEKALLPVLCRGTKPVLRRLRTAEAEGEWIVGEIQRARFMAGGMLKGEDCAILLRSASLSRHVESALGKKGIPYRMIGGHKFFERKEIKILLDYLRVVHQPTNNDALSRIINVPKRGIGAVTINTLLEEAEVGKRSLWQVLVDHCEGTHLVRLTRPQENKIRGELIRTISSLRRQVEDVEVGKPQPLIEVIQRLMTQLNYEEFLKKEFGEDHEGRWATVQEFVNLATDFMMDHGDSGEDALPDIEEVEQQGAESLLGRFLANISLSSASQQDQKDGDTSEIVTICTIHAAKGLEWPIVFIPCVYNGSIPHSRSEDSDEERRLLYVAMTRAKALLYLSCPNTTSWGHGDAELSSFVSEFADKVFADQGPSFHAHIMEEIAKILGRSAPSEKTVFDQLPPMFSTEDDLFPVDPSFREQIMKCLPNSRARHGDTGKRQRISGPGSAAEVDWTPGYKTTMQESSNFTMKNLPGFMTASARQNMAAAEEAEDRAAKMNANKTGPKRKHDQHSLLGYVTSGLPVVTKPPQQPTVTLPRLSFAPQTAPPAIDPSLAHHRIVQKPVLPQPGVSGKPRHDPKDNYGCFSSSPTQPISPGSLPKQTAVPQQPASNRPISIMHSTTSFQSGKIGGVRRPAGIEGPPVMDRVRKPFKPLTLNRSAEGRK
ncbi:ATP-depentend DNA helicase [Cordyceps javanica]|uniref:DNA 3'-5' helicase n=1 Tax=Cordyceps javanica TaxID=43265 RepID=A0A545V751_9HYPO|nr:ATP-depentend DNA helicase [Cordyceps javanica]TQW09280.1 ATP-depentend DNA helicase [Cordyceps javanica]